MSTLMGKDSPNTVNAATHIVDLVSQVRCMLAMQTWLDKMSRS